MFQLIKPDSSTIKVQDQALVRNSLAVRQLSIGNRFQVQQFTNNLDNIYSRVTKIAVIFVRKYHAHANKRVCQSLKKIITFSAVYMHSIANVIY